MTFIFDPADTHARAVIRLPDGSVVHAGETFKFDGNAAAHFASKIERVPGRVVGGVQRPCIVPVDAPASIQPSGLEDERRHFTEEEAREREMAAVRNAVEMPRTQFNRLAALVGLPADTHPEKVVAAVEARLTAKVEPLPGLPLPDAGTRLDPEIAGPPFATAVSTVPGATLPSEPAEAPTERRTYTLAALEGMTNTALDDLAVTLGVEFGHADKRSKASRIEALRAAGVVEG